MNWKKGTWVVAVGGMLGALLLNSGCQKNEPAVGQVRNPQGTVSAKFAVTSAFADVKDQAPLAVGGAVRTGKSSSAELVFDSKGQISLKPESFFEVRLGQTVGRQEGGTAIYRFQKQKEEIKIETPQGVTSVLGTVFLLKIEDEATTVVVDEGKVAFVNLSGEQAVVSAKEKLVAKAGGKLPPPEPLDPMTRNSFFGSDNKTPLFNQH